MGGGKIVKLFFLSLALAFAIFADARIVFAYPDAEVLGPSDANPPFDLGFSSTLTGFLLTSDSRMIVSYGDMLKLVDLGTYALEPTQPPELSTTDNTDGNLQAIAYISASDEIIASQDDGDVLFYDLGNISANPTSTTILADKSLGPIAIDTDAGEALISNNTDRTVAVLNLSSRTVTSTITLSISGLTQFSVTDALYNSATRESYFATSVGRVFYIASGATTASAVIIDSTNQQSLSALSATAAGDYIYVANETSNSVNKISTSSHSATTIDISPNKSPTDIVVTSVKNPNGAYVYVAGNATPTGGVTVINTSNDSIIDLGTDPDVSNEPLPVSEKPSLLAASSSTDGYIYMGFATQKLGIISANPFITFNSVTFNDGKTKLTKDGTMTINFTSDQTGTYTIRAGGNQAASGTLLKDQSGNTSGSVTADTALDVVIKQADNTSAFSEGSNHIWIFVSNGTETGRRAYLVDVDTPPPAVTMNSVGFGNTRLYVNFARLTVADMASYRVYVDTDRDTVRTKTEVAATVAQASSGTEQTAEVSGLTNGLTYYVAMDAVDAGGNVSETRTYQLADGSLAFGGPEETVGPAGMLGEKGCLLVPGRPSSAGGMIFLFLAIVILRIARFSVRRTFKLAQAKACYSSSSGVASFSVRSAIIFFLFLMPLLCFGQSVSESNVGAVHTGYTESPQMWSMEVKGGFWLPKNGTLENYFGKCCNVIPQIEGGLLLHRRYGVYGSIGFLYKTANAMGVSTGAQSQDRFSFILMPLNTSFVWRADYFSWRYVIPYARAGVDYVFFRECDKGAKCVKGFKYGLDGGGGMMINIGEAGDFKKGMDMDTGVNDLFFTLEARYQWINNFGGKSLDLSGGIYSAGLLFEF